MRASKWMREMERIPTKLVMSLTHTWKKWKETRLIQAIYGIDRTSAINSDKKKWNEETTTWKTWFSKEQNHIKHFFRSFHLFQRRLWWFSSQSIKKQARIKGIRCISGVCGPLLYRQYLQAAGNKVIERPLSNWLKQWHSLAGWALKWAIQYSSWASLTLQLIKTRVHDFRDFPVQIFLLFHSLDSHSSQKPYIAWETA